MLAVSPRTRAACLCTRVLPAALLALAWTSPLPAQTLTLPPVDELPFVIGRVSLFPAFALRDVGVDSNILNDTDNPR
jgi:hypothetical protein